MNTAAERLYALLPAIHRIRDAEKGYPLRELLAVIGEQVEAMEENLEQLYDDQFIETCAPWVAPYIGDLIGYRSMHGVAPGVSSPRADVANTIRYRRRKGTASMLEQMAHDVTGWPARAVEFFQLLGWTQNMNHLRANAHYAPNLRNYEKLHWRDTAFDTIAHTVDVRRISAGAARHNIPNIGIYLWRVREFSLTRSPAAGPPAQPTPPSYPKFYRFNPLGTDMALFNKPETEEEISHLAEPRNVPMQFDRRWLKDHLGDYYGIGKSLAIELEGNPPQLIPLTDIMGNEKICICDLSDIDDGSGNLIWAHQPAAGSGKVAIDPVLGRIAFADAPASWPLVSFHYGFTAAIGGGEYERAAPAVPVLPVKQVKEGEALQSWLGSAAGGGTVEALDSYTYAETPPITVNGASTVNGKLVGKTLVLRAANGARPLLKASGVINITLGEEATLILDGWVISGGTLQLGGDKPCHLILRDCTLVPGSFGSAAAPGLVVSNTNAKVELERCITAPLHIVADATVSLRECIVDATAQNLVAFRDHVGNLAPGGALTMESCTVIGKVHTQELTLASDCIFDAELAAGDTWKSPLWAERRQQGCMRFSYAPPNSRTPRRYHCQPDEGGQGVSPEFTSQHYGTPGYCQLLQSVSEKIRCGAHDESEMGVLHGLYQPQRETNLRVRLEEYLRFGLEAGLIYES